MQAEALSFMLMLGVKNMIYKLEKPTLRGPDDVIVKVAFAGICGTDLHILSVSIFENYNNKERNRAPQC